MTINTYDVVGMTCAHCASAVDREVTREGGVDDVPVDLATGVVTVLREDDIDAAAIAVAVTFAGYELLG